MVRSLEHAQPFGTSRQRTFTHTKRWSVFIEQQIVNVSTNELHIGPGNGLQMFFDVAGGYLGDYCNLLSKKALTEPISSK
jgi:hypothetical protein